MWKQLHDKVVVRSAASLCVPVVRGAPMPAPPALGMMRLVCVSDTHNQHAALNDTLPPGDVLIHAGDYSDVGQERDTVRFCAWLREVRPRFKHVVVIAGNHDNSLDRANYRALSRRFGLPAECITDRLEDMLRECCTYLNHEGAVIDGVKFFGSPYQPWFYDWGFNLERGPEIRAKWAAMPTGVDVLVTHGPPLGHGDVCEPDMGHYGCGELLDWVEAHPPRVHVFGHIHEGYGATTNGKTVFVNASTMNVRYDPLRPNPPIVVDIPRPPAAVVPASDAAGFF